MARCAARSKSTNERCKKNAMPGLRVCEMHGGATERAREKSEQAVAVRSMERFAKVYDGDQLMNPVVGFEWEYRRTIGRIIWYDEQLAELDKEALTWSKVRREDIEASEFSGTNEIYEQRANVLHELQFRERQHLIAMEKIYIGAKLNEKKLAMQREYVESLEKVIVGTLTALGHDPADPATRQIVRDQLLALPQRTEFADDRRK